MSFKPPFARMREIHANIQRDAPMDPAPPAQLVVPDPVVEVKPEPVVVVTPDPEPVVTESPETVDQIFDDLTAMVEEFVAETPKKASKKTKK